MSPCSNMIVMCEGFTCLSGQMATPQFQCMLMSIQMCFLVPSETSGPAAVALLSARAQHHSACVQKIQGHLARHGDAKNDRERVKLWASLAKAARKQEVWDVCRAACRFCLLYDDGRWKTPKSDCEHKPGDGSPVEASLHGDGHPPAERLSQSSEKDLLCLLAEVCFINAEATVHKLRTEGLQLNTPAVAPEEKGQPIHEDDAQWAVYRDWIQDLSAYATSNFLRAAELGAEIREAWLVVNAAVYLWNYNSHLLAAGEHPRLLPTFQRVLELLKQTGHAGEPVLFVLLCNVVAKGLLQPLFVLSTSGQGAVQEVNYSVGKGELKKKGATKGAEKTDNVHSLSLNQSALQDLRKALELCDSALHLSNGNAPGENIPIAARKQVISTWVLTKMLLQHQIGPKLDVGDECKNEVVSTMTCVLVGVEMLLCNRHPGQMEFSVPVLATLVRLASDCRWSDPVVELEMWARLAFFSHQAQDHNLVMICSHNALQLEAAATQRLKVTPYALYTGSSVQELLSSSACLRGLSMVCESNGQRYREALLMLQSSVRFAEQAGNPVLCMASARHFWNTCLPLAEIPVERQQLQQPLEKILKALVDTSNCGTTGKDKAGSTSTDSPTVTSILEASSMEVPEEDLTLRAAMYGLLFHIHAERSDWKAALELLEQAVRDVPLTRHRLLLLKHRVLVKAQLGESVLLDMQRITDEGELCCAHMWHKVALCAGEMLQQLSYYQNAITSLLSVESQWQKVDYLLEFGEWLYCQNFPLFDCQQQIHWAIDILLHMNNNAEDTSDMSGEQAGLIPIKAQSHIGFQGLVSAPQLSDLREVKRLDSLVQAHTLLAFMEDRTSPEYQQNLLRAYSLVLRIWQVSLATARDIIKERMKNLPVTTPQPTTARKDKGKKSKEPPQLEEKPKSRMPQEVVVPSSPEDWAQYECPEEVRQAFREDTSPYCINRCSLNKQTQSLFFLDLLVTELQSLGLIHLTLPILHLAELIAHDLLDRRSLSDLYRLRIVKSCCQLAMEKSSACHEKLLSLTGIHEQEQIECRKAIALQREKNNLYMGSNGKTDIKPQVDRTHLSCQDIWIDKAEVCLSIGLYEPARQLLTEAHLLATELGDRAAVGRSLLSLGILANQEQNHSKALALLEKAQDMGGDKDFWHQLTLALVTATMAQRGQDTDFKVDQIIKQGCGALKSYLEMRRNQAADVRFLITSLEHRGALERVRGASPVELDDSLSTQAVQKLMSAGDTLRDTAREFLLLGRREQAAQTLLEHAQALRTLAKHTDHEQGKWRHLLDAYSLTQQAVSAQEHVVLNAQSLSPTQECHPLSLPAVRRLVRLRLSLAELSLALLEQVCAEEKTHALAQDRKASAERTVEEYVHHVPDLSCVEQEWIATGRTLGQVALSQLATVNSLSLDCVETKAGSLSLMGKCLRLLAMQTDPLYTPSLWDGHSPEDWSGVKASPEKEIAPGENGRESTRTEPRQYAAKRAELQKRRRYAQQLLAQATETLAQAIGLSLKHKLPTYILSEACLNMLECHGQFDPCATGQYLALLQSCTCADTMADVLRSACPDPHMSQLSALLNLRRNLLGSLEDTPAGLLKGVEDTLNSLNKVYSQLTINPNHLGLLGELPSNLKILLLQHIPDRSSLYGAFYERNRLTESQKGKATPASGTLVCTRVAKVTVDPRALLDLQDRAQAFGRETKRTFLKEARWRGNESMSENGSQLQISSTSSREEKLESHFKAIVQEMEEYLHPVLCQFDFSSLRNQTSSTSIAENTRPKERDGKASSDKGPAVGAPAERGDLVVLLADWMLLQLPLEALAVLQQDAISSVSRDFSLQVLHTRLQREESVESDNKKETKGGKGSKRKGDQSKSIKVVPLNRVLPPNCLPVDTHNFRYIIDPYNEEEYDGNSLSEWMKRNLVAYSGQFTPFWEGFMGSEHTPSLSDFEQLLTNCSAFIFHGTERFLANIPPSKIVALNISECQMVILFDMVQNSASMLRQTKLDMQKSSVQLDLERPRETALLLTLSGVRSVLLNQWHSSTRRNTLNMDSLLDNLLRAGLTSGQTVHALRTEKIQNTQRDANTARSNDPACDVESGNIDGNANDSQPTVTPSLSAFNFVIYGLPNLVVT